MKMDLLIGSIWLLVIGLGCAADTPTSPTRAAAQSRPCSDDGPEVDFVATVLDCTFLGKFSGTAYCATVDPRFVLTMRLEDDCAALGWSKGQTVYVAIHSPTRVFGATEYLHRRFALRLYRHPEDGRGFSLEVIP